MFFQPSSTTLGGTMLGDSHGNDMGGGVLFLIVIIIIIIAIVWTIVHFIGWIGFLMSIVVITTLTMFYNTFISSGSSGRSGIMQQPYGLPQQLNGGKKHGKKRK